MTIGEMVVKSFHRQRTGIREIDYSQLRQNLANMFVALGLLIEHGGDRTGLFSKGL
jgi:hypothetical protein